MQPADDPDARRRRRLPALAGYRGWKLQDAKAHFSDLVRRAREEGPQRRSRSMARTPWWWSRPPRSPGLIEPAARPSLYELLSRSPLREVDFDFEGERSPVREVEL